MADHRIRLTDDDIMLITAALRARNAALKEGGANHHRLNRLLARLEDGQVGNPQWVLDAESQRHES